MKKIVMTLLIIWSAVASAQAFQIETARVFGAGENQQLTLEMRFGQFCGYGGACGAPDLHLVALGGKVVGSTDTFHAMRFPGQEMGLIKLLPQPEVKPPAAEQQAMAR